MIAGPVPDGLSTNERHRYAIARPDKLGTDPMAGDGIPRVGTRFRLSVGNEQADAGRDGRIRLARPNSQARSGTSFFFFLLLS